ncbi:MAG: hypothetical protein EBR82_19125 [Caulobacteraceae bacterium]|nr:hypothetical protein [Caulobacteraceae bacterium]
MSKVSVEVSTKNNVRAGLDAARADLNKWKKETEGGLKLERDNKIKRNVVGLAGDLANATSGTDALAAAGARLSDVFQNKLGTAIGIGFGVQIVQWIADADRELANFTRRMEELDSTMQGIGSMESGGLQSLAQNFRKLAQENKTAMAGDANIFTAFKDAFSYDYASGTHAGDRKMQEQIKLQQAEQQAAQELIERQREHATILEMRVRDENEAADAMERQLKHAREIKDISLNAAPGSKGALRAESDRIFNLNETLIGQKQNAAAMKPQGGVVSGSLQEAGGGGRAMSFFAGDAGQVLREQLAVAQQVLYAIRSLSPSASALSASTPVRSFDFKK